MSTFGERLKKFREEHLKMRTKADFARRTNIDQTYVGNWERGRNMPDAINLGIIEKSFPELNMDWLITGRGSMLKNKDSISKDLEKEISEISKSPSIYSDPLINQDRVNKLTDTLMHMTTRVDNLSQENADLKLRVRQLEIELADCLDKK